MLEIKLKQGISFLREKSPSFEIISLLGQVKVYELPWPGPSTGMRRVFFEKKGGGDLFRRKLGGAKNFFRKNKGATTFLE